MKLIIYILFVSFVYFDVNIYPSDSLFESVALQSVDLWLF